MAKLYNDEEAQSLVQQVRAAAEQETKAKLKRYVPPPRQRESDIAWKSDGWMQ